MSLKEQIMNDVKTAMRNKESDKLTTLRFLQAAIKNKEIDLRPEEIVDEDVLAVIKKMAKQRKDSIEQFKSAGREDLASKEESELAIIEVYLPAQLSDDKVQEIVIQVMGELNATSMKDMGAVMKEVLAKTGGAADNKLVSQIVRQKLG